jgi:hypothetical protein
LESVVLPLNDTPTPYSIDDPRQSINPSGELGFIA